MPASPYRRYPSHDRPCIHCGTPLAFTVRRDAGYCSSKCRQAAYRARKGARPRASPKG
jgi:predicted nucleic acid-binding Zn ribbon protein